MLLRGRGRRPRRRLECGRLRDQAGLKGYGQGVDLCHPLPYAPPRRFDACVAPYFRSGALAMSEPAASVVGYCLPRFEPLRQLFSELIESGRDLGASLAVTVDDEFALDLWGGWADEARTRRWRRDTITNVFSTTKTMIALAALVLVERGQLDLDAPVARYWPEFAAAGKSGVLVRHILSHTSGLSGWEHPVTLEDVLHDQDRCTALLAAQAPWWTPGSASGYHSYTMG